jgi:hypothetical protein
VKGLRRFRITRETVQKLRVKKRKEDMGRHVPLPASTLVVGVGHGET